MKRRNFISSAIGLAGVSAVGLSGLSALNGLWHPHSELAGDSHIYSGAALAFGSTMTIQVAHHDAHQAGLAIAAALASAQKIDRLMSVYRDNNQVAQLNRQHYLEHADPHLRKVLASALELSHLTRGAFDITVQPLWLAYRAAALRGDLPTTQERLAAMELVDWRQLTIEGTRVSLGRPGMAITLNGIAQGYAVDVARAVLSEHGIEHALLDTGEFAASGRKSTEQEWTVGIRDPRDPQALADILPLRDRCLATSGDYESSFTPDFAHHHIFDPASGDSPDELASVSVIAASGMQADGLSTAMMVLGAKKALALAATLKEVEVLLIAKDGSQWRSAPAPVTTQPIA